MIKNNKNKTNSYNKFIFLMAVFLLIASFSFFSLADENNGKSIFEDFDGDGLSNSEEEAFGTDKNNRDTDGDGYSDSVEIESGYDPLKSAPGDKIINDKMVSNDGLDVQGVDGNTLTEKLSKDLIDYMGDVQEAGDKNDISTADLEAMVSKSIKEEVSFEDIEIDLTGINIKEQDYSKLSKKERKAKEKEDAIEYFTTVSYIFMTNFPDGFFDGSEEELFANIMSKVDNFTTDLTQIQYFEDLAKNAAEAEKDLQDIQVPESLIDIHFQGMYLLRYAGMIYQDGDYKDVENDAVSMVVTLTKIQGWLELVSSFFENTKKIMDEYEIEEVFFDF
jgi:hypothetical protein